MIIIVTIVSIKKKKKFTITAHVRGFAFVLDVSPSRYSDGVEPRRHPSALRSSNQLTAQGCRSALKAQRVTFKKIYWQKKKQKATENTSVCF